MSNPGLPNFQGSKISSQSKQIHKNLPVFNIWAPNVKKCAFLAILFHIWGVLGGPYVEPRITKFSGQ